MYSLIQFFAVIVITLVHQLPGVPPIQVPQQKEDIRDGRYLYVSLLQQKQIICFKRDDETGELTRAGTTECPAEPAFLNCSADGSLLFVSLRSNGQIASYHVDSATGHLKLLSVVSGGKDPAFLQVDGSGRFLATAYYAANKVSIHRIAADGSLSAEPVQTVPTAERAHGAAFTSDNKWMLVPHTGANRVYSFGFEEQTGLLSPSDPPFLATPIHHQPRHIVLHKSDRWAYTSNEKGDSISMYSLKNGQMILQQTVSTIPADFDGERNSTARCLITPNSQFAYVSNRGHDSIAAFAIDQTTGELSSLGQVPTEKTPRSLAVNSAGNFLYAAGEASGRLATYRIQADGRLEQIGTCNSGPVSWAIVSVDCKNH